MLGDAAATALLFAVAVIAVLPLLRADDLATGAGDWPAHAYRIRSLGDQGLAPWSHDWAAGLPLWSSYQFVPHAAVLTAMRITGAAAGRAMVVGQALLLIWIPLAVLVTLRRFRVGTVAALAGALVTLALDGRRQPTANFSELWGLALAPVTLGTAWATVGRRTSMLTAAFTGAAIYVHPLAAVTGAVGMTAATLARPRLRRLAVLPVQAVVAAGVAAFSLLPLAGSARPAYEDPYFTSATFARLLARLTVSSFAPGWPVAFIAAAVCTAIVATHGSEQRRRGARYLLLVAAIVAVLAFTSMAAWGPHLYREMQLPRLLALAPLLAAAAFALGMDELLARGSANAVETRWERCLPRAAAWALALPLVALAARSHAAALGPVRGAAPASSFARWLVQAQRPLDGQRIAASPEVVADASAYAYGRAWYTGSYSGREWSILSGPLALFLNGFGGPETGAAYLVAMAVDLVVVPSGRRPPLADPRTGEPTAWSVAARLDGVDLLRPPWRAPAAFTVPRGAEAGMDVPDYPFNTVEQAYVRDELTRRYAALALGPSAVPARVRAPSATAIDVEVRDAAPGGTLLISTNWDRDWHAEAGTRSLPVRRGGPNLVAIDLADAPRGPGGDVHVRLHHHVPAAWWAGAGVAVATLGAVALTLMLGARAAMPGVGEQAFTGEAG